MAIGQVRPSFKTAFKNVRSLGPLYTSGPITFTPDGSRIVTCVGEDVLLTDVETGTELCRFMGDSQTIHSLCTTPSGSHLVTFSASLSLRIYELPITPPENKRVQPIRTIARAHDSPVHVCKVDPTSTYLASGSADGVVKVWDIHRGFVTHLFKGHGGIVSALVFHFPHDASSLETPTMRLITASVDTQIRIFNLTSGASTSSAGGKPEVALEGHVSVPRGLDVSQDGRWLISAGRDSVALIWDLYAKFPANQPTKKKVSAPSIRPTLAKTIPVLERAEAVGFLPAEHKRPAAGGENNLSFYTGGSKGVIKIWDGQSGEVLWRSSEEFETVDDSEEQRQIVDVLYVPSTSTLASVHADQNILCYDLPTRRLRRQLIGYNDEIIDATFLSSSSSDETPTTYLALATNSSLIRVYATNTFDARLLEGHADIVLALTSSGDGKLLASSSKDKTARIWISTTPGHSLEWGYQCVGICEGHAESVGALTMPRRQGEMGTLSFMFTGSQDRTIKMWDLTPLQGQLGGFPVAEVTRCHSLTTFKAHDKDINSLDVAPNNRLLVSGSQDKTAKIYEIIYTPGSKASTPRGELRLLGICKGHKRGVWTVKFSPTDRLVATGSGDKTVKLWNLDDFSCIKTFEGHTNSVLRVDFLTMGLQLVTSASDGLVKVWNIQDEECVTTLDNHEDKVWALAIDADGRTLVSGAADSVVTFWEDSTEAEAAEKESQRAEMVVKDQDFLNYVALRDYRKALELALAMNQPGRLYSLFRDLASSAVEETSTTVCTGNALVDEVIRTLATPDLARLLSFVRIWNSNAKTSDVAQRVLFAIVKLRSSDDVIRVFEDEKAAKLFVDAEDASSTGKSGMVAIKELIEAIVPYTERHLSKVDRLLQESYVIDYILGEMDDGMFDADDTDSIMEVEVY